MPHFNQRAYELSREYRQRKQQQAQHQQLIASVRSKTPSHGFRLARVYKPTLFLLGRQLESIGTQLQVRYGDLKPSHSKR